MKRNCFVGEVWSNLEIHGIRGMVSVPHLIVEINEYLDEATLLNLETGELKHVGVRRGLAREVWSPVAIIKSSLSDHRKAKIVVE